ncbi:MAG: hypothetical protein K6D94_03325 [Clostridiales bacterium]|nr:hypothetical protein [Clostridiales bacterium]
MSKAVRSISAVLNIVFAVLAIGAVAWYFNDNGSFDPDEFHVFRYYTTDSNILAAVSAIIVAVCEFRGVRSKAAVIFKYVGTCTVTVTFMTVLCFLGPLVSYHGVYNDEAFWLHMVCPIGFFLTFVFLDLRGERISKKPILWSLIPTLIYGAVYIIMVIIIGEDNGGWPDFYSFNAGGMFYVTLPVMVAASAVISALIRLARNAASGRKKAKTE